ncbi:MAG TPA: site-specific integrase [Candidatus Binataceae bacterium]|nr:site-specific integrase [Candidatus Binataceae bacterium]
MKRGQNEGSIRHRGDGRWEARLNLGRANGKRVRKSLFGPTRDEVARKLAEFTAQRNAGLPVPRGVETVGAFLTGWLDHVRTTVAPRTYESYELYVRLHAIPEIGHVRLAALRPDHVRALLAHKLKGGLSPRSVIHLRTILNTAFRQAVNDRLLAWNPVGATKRPKTARHKYQVLELEQARAFLDAAHGSKFECALALSLSLGVRLGEVLGLRWQDIDLDARELHIEQTIQRLRARIAGTAGYYVAEPKTDRSRRHLVVPDALIALLRRQRAAQAEQRLAAGSQWLGKLGLVFTNETGGPMDARALRAEFKRILAGAGLAAMRLQDLRHSAASILLAQGVTLRGVMEVLGHSTITLTANTYGHVAHEMMADAATRMGAIFGPRAGNA